MTTQPNQQGAVQGAVARVSVVKQVADAVLEACGDSYLSASDLFLKPSVRQLVRDTGHMSIALSDAYKAKLIGRIYAPDGKHTYAYGPKGQGAEAEKRSRKVIGTKKDALYVVEFEVTDASRVLEILRSYPDLEWGESEGKYILKKTAKPEDLLLFLSEVGLLRDCLLTRTRK